MWKIELIIKINFICSKDNDEERVIHSESGKVEIMISNEKDEVVK